MGPALGGGAEGGGREVHRGHRPRAALGDRVRPPPGDVRGDAGVSGIGSTRIAPSLPIKSNPPPRTLGRWKIAPRGGGVI